MLGLRPARYCLREGVYDVDSNRRSARLVHKVGRYTITPKILYLMYLYVQCTSLAAQVLRLFVFLSLIYLPYLRCLLKIDRCEIKGRGFLARGFGSRCRRCIVSSCRTLYQSINRSINRVRATVRQYTQRKKISSHLHVYVYLHCRPYFADPSSKSFFDQFWASDFPQRLFSFFLPQVRRR